MMLEAKGPDELLALSGLQVARVVGGSITYS